MLDLFLKSISMTPAQALKKIDKAESLIQDILFSIKTSDFHYFQDLTREINEARKVIESKKVKFNLND